MDKHRRLILGLSIFASIVLAENSYASVRLALDSVSLDFGRVDTGSFKELTLQVWDTTTTDVQIDAVSPSGSAASDFVVISPSFPTIVPSGGITVIPIVIRFRPSAIGQRNALLLIQTSDGSIAVPVSGLGKAEVSGLFFSMSKINFGALSPVLQLDTIVELYSSGPDSATILGGSILNGSTSTFAATILDSSGESVLKIGPGDSIAIRITVNGFLPTGPKEAAFSVLGQTSTPSLDLIADVEWATFTLDPAPIVDFGVMYAGEVRDTLINITNTGVSAFAINEVDPPTGDFHIVNEPAIPIFVRTGETAQLTVRANPGISTYHAGEMAVISMNSQNSNYLSTHFQVSVAGNALQLPSSQSVSYYCAMPGSIEVTVPVLDTISRSFAVTGVLASDPSIIVHPVTSFPDTIGAGMTQQIMLHIDQSSTSANKIILQFLGGTQIVATDTLYLTDLLSNASIALSPLPSNDSAHRSFDVRTQTTLTPFMLDTLVVHLASSNDATEIDISSIALAPGLSNAHILSIVRDVSGYVVTIASSLPLTSLSGSSILSFQVKRFISDQDSTNIELWAEAPERTGCLEWAGDTEDVPLPSSCGSGELQYYLSKGSLLWDVHMQQNPVRGAIGHIAITAGAPAVLDYDIMSVLGERVAHGIMQLDIGHNDLELPIGLIADGSYYVKLVAHARDASVSEVNSLLFIKRD